MRDFLEDGRLDALHRLNLLDTGASESFDRITRMASQIFGLPMAAISLTDRDRQWFKSRVGIGHSSIPRFKAPCAQVAGSKEVLVIEDLHGDPTYCDSLLGRNGTRFYAGVPLVTSDGYGLGSLCVLGTAPRTASESELATLRDLAAMVMAQIELQHAFGRLDPVSGLATCHQFYEDLADLALDEAGQPKVLVVVKFARDDQINGIMRAMGGARVDELVREATHILRDGLEGQPKVYHVGAAQFAFLMPSASKHPTLFPRLREHLNMMRLSSSTRYVANIAIGVRPFVLAEASARDLLRGALTAAEDAHRTDDFISTYSETRDGAHRRRYALLEDFGAALEADDQLSLVYQPRVELATGRCISVEALLRWRHPRLGDVSPSEFIPIVEQTSLARATTQRVLEMALDQLARWDMAGIELMVSVNISAANLAEPDLAQRIQAALVERQLLASRLEIELPESATMDHPEQALGMLRQLDAAGICLSIGDFGTGYSSLSYLQRVPVQVLKIERAFVSNLGEAPGADHVLVDSMIQLAHRLGYRVVAEGVETGDTLAALREMGCEEAQGYHFALPMEADELARWLSRNGQAENCLASTD
ncbi:sensor domain-containing phosphodiesterase [Polymorphobacter multimanifer]|uniref:sensor domain-containing phosphodiesterase n=1 Tax=Polymorphobacter multimanifer TaxID=1070431 RepID=UPI0016635776|nr:sensor domain-containing phosphodiesterase [Polymorphobacter multimanifer]GGI67136.1 sensor domain-containing phosphodiesterase [Polymorphobacter multimanifer]